MRDFKIADKVKFGVGTDGTPMWSYTFQKLRNLDRYKEGKVVEILVRGSAISVEFTTDNGTIRYWVWAQPSSVLWPTHVPEGYIELIETDEEELQEKATSEKKCTCPWDLVYSSGCKCGGT